MKVLFCTDGSKISFNALHNFAKWAPENTIIDTICVIDWSFLPDDVVIEADGFSTSCANIADNLLEYAKKEVEKTGLLFGEKIKQCGSAVESILEQAQKECYDIVLLGSHGKKGIQKWLGSVSREIAYNENISTYISKEENGKMRVLFATDGTEISNFAITKAIEELNLENKEIFLCTVNENPDTLFLDGTLDSNWILAIEEQQEKYSYSTLNNLKERFKTKGFEIEDAIVLTGNPAQKIIDFAKSRQIDLIIMGSKGKTKMQDFLLGSVSKKVLESTNSDVLIYKNSL